MAYILLALGALMSLVGLAAMISGYPMIEIERGWATVITGAVLFSGGLVVVALGLVVRNLVGLRSALSVVGALPASEEAPARQLMSSPPMPALPVSPSSSETPATTRLPAAAFDPTPALGVAVPAAVAALAAGAAHGHDERDARQVAEARHVQETPSEVHDAEPLMEAQASETFVPSANDQQVHASEPAQDHESVHQEPVHQEPVHDEPVHHEPVGALGEAEHAKRDGDWLDQAFSAFDHEMTTGYRHDDAPSAASPEPPARTEPAEDSQEHDRPAHELSAREAEPDAPHPSTAYDTEYHEPEPHDAPAEAPATAPAEPSAELAVIGRYDSDGTSYVMYSDGSIEAQSEAGIYRFGSMAELKAFIEN